MVATRECVYGRNKGVCVRVCVCRSKESLYVVE